MTSGSDRVIVPLWVPDRGTEGLPRGPGGEQAARVRRLLLCVSAGLCRGEGASQIQQVG